MFLEYFQGFVSMFRFWQHDFDLPRWISSVFISLWEIHLIEFCWVSKFKVFMISGCFPLLIMKIFYTFHLLSLFFLGLQLHQCLMAWYFPTWHWGPWYFSWIFLSLWFYIRLFLMIFVFESNDSIIGHHQIGTSSGLYFYSSFLLIPTAWFLGSFSYERFSLNYEYIVLCLYRIGKFVIIYWILWVLYCTDSEFYDILLNNIYCFSSR